MRKQLILSCVSIFINYAIFPSAILAQDFTYKSVLYCGSKKYKELGVLNEFNNNVFFIHTDKAGKFVIWHEGIQYPSFSKNKVYHLFIQNGQTAYATKESNESFVTYKLNIDDDRKRIIRIDMFAMTYVSRIDNFSPYSGSCEWLIDENGKDMQKKRLQ